VADERLFELRARKLRGVLQREPNGLRGHWPMRAISPC
jgi:hypothetical protein